MLSPKLLREKRECSTSTVGRASGMSTSYHFGLFDKVRFRESGGLGPMDSAVSVGVQVCQTWSYGNDPRRAVRSGFCLPVNLLYGSFPETEEVDSLEGYLGKMKRKLGEIHCKEKSNWKE